MPFQDQKPHPRCHKNRNVTQTSYCHRQVKTQTHQHDMYLFQHVVYQHCLASPTLSRIYLTQYPFCMWSFGPMGSNLIHTLKDLPVSCKVGASNLACRHKNEVITNITTQGQTHIKTHKLNVFKIYSLLPSTFIRYFNNQISTIFSKPSKAFLVKKNLHQFPR